MLRTSALIALALVLAGCAPPPLAQRKVARLIVVEPREDWGPIVLGRRAQVPVELSESGVAVEAVGSSAPQ